ncbi:MAG: type IV secretion system DNA-binding domain-containing protein [Patescibacteria group bacterium]
MTPTTLLIAMAVFVLLVVVVTAAVFAKIFRNRQKKAYEHDIYLVTIPKFSETGDKQKTPQPAKSRLSHVESLFAVMSSIKAERGWHSWLYGRSDHFALEMIAKDGLINFYISTPRALTDLLIQQVQNVYPHVHFQPVPDYNIFRPQGAIIGGYLILRRDFIFPLKTYQSFEDDPLEGITTALSKIPEDSGAAVQFIVRSAKKAWRAQGRTISHEAHKLGSLSRAIKNQGPQSSGLRTASKIGRGFFSVIGATFASHPKKDLSQNSPLQREQLSAMDMEAVKAIEQKCSKGGFDVNIRLVVSSPTVPQSELLMKNLMNSFGHYNIYEYGNALKPIYVGSQEKIINNFIYRYYEPRARAVLNSEEMVSLFHLPEGIDTPNIRWLKAKTAAPPMELPKEGILLGRATYRGHTVDVRIKDADRRRHVYIIGQTGVGKSVLIESMAIQDIERGKGVCIIDPHGDLIEKVLSRIPEERTDDVIIFDPSDTDRPLALNMLEFYAPEQKTFVINEMINIFDKLYDLRQTGGPMFEQYMRNTMLLMMEDTASGSTLMEVSKVLADERFRRYKLSKAKNPVVRDFWEKEAQKAGGEAALANMVPYITSKLTQFIANDIMRPIIAQQNSSFDFRKVMDEQKILLINLSKGKIGDMNSMLLGLVCVGKLLMAALSRVDMPEDERKDFYLYIDEFQNYITDSIAIILSEARKYKLNLTIAHQYIAQLIKRGDTAVRDAVFGNVGTIVAFRVGVEDAETIAQQFAPVVDTYDVMNIEKFNAYISILGDNPRPPSFNFSPEYKPLGDPKRILMLKEISRMRYGRPREEIEREIVSRSGLPAEVKTPLPPVQ